MATSRISQLAATIQENTSIIDEYYATSGIPSPSFDVDFPSDLPARIHGCRNAILEATDELSDLMLGAAQLAEGSPPRHTALISIQAIARYDIAEKIEIDEEVSFAELAQRTGLPEDDLTRIMRQAAAKHIFKETKKGYLSHTAASKLFIGNSNLKDWAHIAFDEVWQSAAHLLDAMDKWPGSGEPNHTGFNLAKGGEESYFESMKSNKRREKAFASTMSYMQERHGFGNTSEQLLSAYDWASAKTVVDIGGSLGATSADIVRRFPSVRCTVLDLPEVVADARQRVSEDVSKQITFEAHDFFKDEPVQDADVYLLRWILHDWSDQRAVSILQNLVPGLKNGANVIVQEFILPEPGLLPSFHEKTIRNMDIAMKAVFNSKERSIEDWMQVFEKADPRFKIVSTKANDPPGSNLAILHFRWLG